MAFFEWTPALSVGIASIDRQHQQLIGYINQLHAAVLAGNSQPMLRAILTGLGNYTRVHFSYEEMLFKVYGYQEAAEHIDAHFAFVNAILQFTDRVGRGDVSFDTDLLDYLKSWLRQHVLIEDMAYAHSLQAAGAH